MTSSETPHLFQPLNLPMVIRARPNRLWVSVYGVSGGKVASFSPFVSCFRFASVGANVEGLKARTVVSYRKASS